MSIMVYHGSYMPVEEPDTQHSTGEYLDFGTGFYVSQDFDTAAEYAIVKALNHGGIATVTSYAFYDEDLTYPFYSFGSEPTDEWFNVVASFRQSNTTPAGYEAFEVLTGLVSDARAIEIFDDFFNGILTQEETISKLFKFDILQPQICFKTDRAIKETLIFAEEITEW